MSDFLNLLQRLARAGVDFVIVGGYAGVDKGLADIKAGKVIPHEEAKKSLKKWLTK